MTTTTMTTTTMTSTPASDGTLAWAAQPMSRADRLARNGGLPLEPTRRRKEHAYKPLLPHTPSNLKQPIALFGSKSGVSGRWHEDKERRLHDGPYVSARPN
jgi:hypothetical protein